MKKTFLRLKTFILVKDLKTLVIVPYQKLSCFQNLIFGPGYMSKRSNLIQNIDSTWKNNPHTNFYHGIYQQIVILRFHNNDNLLRNGPLEKSNNQDLWDPSHCSTTFINVLTIYDYLNRLFFPFISA